MKAKRRKFWVQQVAVGANAAQIRLNVARARQLTAEQRAAADGVQQFLDSARAAADRQDPQPRRFLNWWRGVLVEAAFQNLHAARVQLVDLYSDPEIDAEVPGAAARARAALGGEDPRCITPAQLRALPEPQRRARLRVLVEDGYEGVDLKHTQLRSFRNIILGAAVVIIVLVLATTVAVSLEPSTMPLCFPRVKTSGAIIPDRFNCPTQNNTASGASGGDVWIVALLGLLGGTLAASVAIRKIRGTSTPYDVPVALAWLKVPLGAFTAILGIVAIHGAFLPGLSVLDSQQQILAYALLLGVAQQLFTSVLDKRAQDVLENVPSKGPQSERPGPVVPTPADESGDVTAEQGPRKKRRRMRR